MIKDIKELNFPAYATLETATATISDMGDRTITSQVKIDGDVVPDFSYDWEVEFKGERYIHPVKTPQGTKDNTSRKSKIDLVFQHWAIYEMKRQYFVEMAATTAGTAIADKYIASLGLNLGDFVTAFNLVLNHYFDDRIVIRLNPEWQYDAEAKFVSISYSYIWDVLQQMHEIYGVRWTLKTNADGVCEILLGYPAEEVSHIFEYGFEGGLLSVQRQVQSTEIRNRLLGRGGSKNLPYRYFKDKDPNNPLFEADPDWIPELANIAFTELRGKTFRDYVKGWKAKHYDGAAMDEPTEAYLAGYNAEKFDPIEYVDDKESIEKYGILVGALENNEEIYPSIQGAPGDVDMIVDAEQVTDDDVDAAVENDSVTTNLESGHQTYRNAPANSTITIETLTKRHFSVPAGKVGNLDMSLTVTGKYSNVGDYEPTYPILKTETVNITVHDSNTDEIVKSSVAPVVNLPAGDYYYMISVDVETNYDRTSMVTLNIESVYLYTSTPNKSEGWKQTFDIWVRNIWGSERNAGENDQQYADRVWLPILGDRMGDEARVVFASGWLSFSSDWEFPIVGYAYDDSKEGSHWRLTLAKSEAELEASGKYIPYEGYNASAGDRFFFIGIDMPWQYVYWGEERIDDYKRDTLPETARINPSWVIKTDKVRLNQNREGAKLIDSLSVGAQIRLASKQFISGSYESLYVQSMTYNWTADTILYPDVEVVVSDKVATVKNPVAQMQGNIETLQRQVGSLSNIQQIIRQVCDQLYLRKDGVEDLSKSPTRFLGKVTGKNFRQGQIGGKDWGIYRDENGNAILEADKLVARQGILVTDLVVNEATYVGGLQIRSAAHMDVTSVEDTEAGYVCSFDQKQGSVTNKFTEDDVVLCQKFDADQSEVKFYKRRVVSVSETSVTLSKTDVNGTGVPAEEDVIIHYGNYTDKSRQFVIISDVIGGGYERMLMGLDSVASDGVEYYFAGKSADSKARWFVGGTEQYAEYKNGQLTIKGNIFVTGSDQSINEQIAQLDFIREAFGEGAQGLILGSAIIVGDNDVAGKFIPMAGLSGVYDATKQGGGIAAWYGGNMVDAEDGTGAQSLFRFDGSGYLAGGNIRWDKKGAGAVAGGDISWDEDGNITLGNGIKITADGDETLGSLLIALNNKFDKKGGEINGNVDIKGKLSMSTLVIPNAEGIVGEHTLMIGEVGAGAATPEGGGSGTADFSQIKVYDTNGNLLGNGASDGKITIVPYPVVPTDVSAFNNDAGYLKEEDIEGKVDKVDGKGLSTEDFTTALKNKLQGLSNYDDSAINDKIDGIQDQIDTLVSGDAATAIESFNEIIAFLNGVEDTETLEGIIAAIEQQIASKVSTETFNALATKVGTAETAIATNATAIATNKTNIATNTTDITNLKTRADGLQGNIEDLQDDVTTILDDYLSKANGGIIKGAVTIQAALKMNTLYLPNSNNTPSDYTLSVGSLGSGADTPEGGSGIAQVTINVNGSPYKTDANGAVTLPNYPTTLPASDVYDWAKAATKPSYAFSEITGKPTTLAGYGITDNVAYKKTRNNFIHDDNEFTFAAPAYSGLIWINYRTASGNPDGAITEYRFAQGAGESYANIRAAKYIVNGGTSSQFLKADGSLDGTSYLPLSGGALGGNLSLSGTLAFNSSNLYLGAQSTIFRNASTTADYGTQIINSWNAGETRLILNKDAAYFRDVNGNNNTLIHSGNIGSYALKFYPYDWSSNTYNTNDVVKNQIINHDKWSNAPISTIASLMDLSYSSDWRWQLFACAVNQTLYSRFRHSGTTWTDWKTIAFTDSNVASAQKLKTADGKSLVQYNGVNTLYIGDGIYDTSQVDILGSKVVLRYGTSGINGLILNSSGNVTIGASDLASTNVKLYVSGKATIDGDLSALGTINLRPGTNLYGSFAMNANRMSIQALHDGVAYLPIALNPSGGNVLIGTADDSGVSGKLLVNGGVTLDGYMSNNSVSKIADLNGKGLVVGTSAIRSFWGMAIWTEGNGKGMIQQQAFTTAAPTYPICLQPFGGNVLIGTTTDNGEKLQVNGSLRVQRYGDVASYLNITVSDVQVQYNGWDAGDGYVYHDFFSNGNQIARIDGRNNSVIAYRCMQAPLIEIPSGLSVMSSISTIYNYLSFNSIGNEICVSGNDNDILYVNYRASHAGFAPTVWKWKAGSSSSWAQMEMGNIISYGNISASGYQLPTSAPSNPVSGGYYLYVGTLGTGATIS